MGSWWIWSSTELSWSYSFMAPKSLSLELWEEGQSVYLLLCIIKFFFRLSSCKWEDFTIENFTIERKIIFYFSQAHFLVQHIYVRLFFWWGGTFRCFSYELPVDAISWRAALHKGIKGGNCTSPTKPTLRAHLAGDNNKFYGAVDLHVYSTVEFLI